MWSTIARSILKKRILYLVLIGVLTIFMGLNARKVAIQYEFARLLPEDDSTTVEYERFKSQFGQDGVVMVVGLQSDQLFELSKFNEWYDLTYDIKKVDGIQEVVSVARLYNLTKNDSLGKFDFNPLMSAKPTTQQELDSLKEIIYKLPFYDGFVFNKETNSTLMAITFKNKDVNSKHRLSIVDSIKAKVDAFNVKTQIPLFYSGLPYIRTVIARMITHEMVLFMVLAVIVTCIILLFFFRSVLPVVVSMLVVLVGVLWSYGSLVLFGYKLSVLSGLIPPLIIVIGVPNCILLLNKYHTEYSHHHNKARALIRTIEKIGVSLFFANVTTAIGFAVFCSTKSKILVEFGLISSINVIITYVISLILIPIIFSYLPPPSVKHTKHLQSNFLSKILRGIDHLVHHYRPAIYTVVIITTLVSIYGITHIKPLGYVVDDLPKNNPVYEAMGYFEKNYGGVLPYEITIDTKKEKGVFADDGRALYLINNLYKLLKEYPSLSRPISIIDGVKFSYQAYKDGNPKYYRLPGALDFAKIAEYANDAKGRKDQFKSFIDSTRRYARVSVQMADIGSIKMKELNTDLKPRIDSIFNFDHENNKWLSNDEQYKITVTGQSQMFLKGNDFLVANLLESVLLAIILITIVMFTLFMSPRMILISVLPSTFPLLVTAGLMGFFDIHLKPSTILIFSIAFGIASDGTLYFLTKYRQEFKNHHYSISKTVSAAIRETGISMIYTAVILACGFGIFTASEFGGTAALGLLISFTLLVAYCSNLLLLPCFLLSMEKRMVEKAMRYEPLIELIEEEEDIDIERLSIDNTPKHSK